MLNWSEVLLVWPLLAIVLVPILVVVQVASGRTSFLDSTALVATPPTRWLDEVVLQLAGLSRQRVRFLSPTSVEIVTWRRPAWTIVVAVLFFPLGLVALLFTTDDVAVVTAHPEGELTRVRMRGYFTGLAVAAVNRTIPELTTASTRPLRP